MQTLFTGFDFFKRSKFWHWFSLEELYFCWIGSINFENDFEVHLSLCFLLHAAKNEREGFFQIRDHFTTGAASFEGYTCCCWILPGNAFRVKTWGQVLVFDGVVVVAVGAAFVRVWSLLEVVISSQDLLLVARVVRPVQVRILSRNL